MDKLVDCCVPRENRDLVKSLINNEEFHYIEPQHKNEFLDKLWKIANAVFEYNYIEVTYTRLKGTENGCIKKASAFCDNVF